MSGLFWVDFFGLCVILWFGPFIRLSGMHRHGCRKPHTLSLSLSQVKCNLMSMIAFTHILLVWIGATLVTVNVSNAWRAEIFSVRLLIQSVN